MAKGLVVSACVLGVLGAMACASGGGGSHPQVGGAGAAFAVTIDESCNATPADAIVNEGDKVEFSAPANYRVVLDEKADSGAYFEGQLVGYCSNVAKHAKKFDVPKRAKFRTCKIGRGSGPHDQTWHYSVTLFDDAGQHCQVDPNICVKRCN